jgi:hypothetical protein
MNELKLKIKLVVENELNDETKLVSANELES